MNTEKTDDKVEIRTPALPNKDGFIESNNSQAFETWEIPEWKVSGIFSSNMVLQRDVFIKVWGWCRHIGAIVSGVWEKEKVSTEVDANGYFELIFSPHKANINPTIMKISSEYGCSVFNDILVGDVWVIGGQSNAELNLSCCPNDRPEVIETISHNHPIRLFSQTRDEAYACQKYHNTPSKDIINPNWCWEKTTFKSANNFSALGYYFARILIENIDIPIGVIMMCAGGARLLDLMPKELAIKLEYDKKTKSIGCFYNTLIAPLIGLQFKGQIFFQGESEGMWEDFAHSYEKDIVAYVEDERMRFGFPFSFYNIQISSYRKEGVTRFPYSHWVRACQYSALKLIPKSYLTVSRDLGADPDAENWAHSTHKYELAKRVANQALAIEYNIGNIETSNSPMPIKAIRKGTELIVEFAFENGGLKTVDSKDVCGFSFTNFEGNEIEATAQIISNDSVKVHIPNNVKTDEVHYALYNDAPISKANLCGGTGLVVPTFCYNI